MKARIGLEASHECRGEPGSRETPAGLAGGEDLSPLRFAALRRKDKTAGVEAGDGMEPAKARIGASADQFAGEEKEVGRIVGLGADDERKQRAGCENKPPHGTCPPRASPRASASVVPI